MPSVRWVRRRVARRRGRLPEGSRGSSAHVRLMLRTDTRSGGGRFQVARRAIGPGASAPAAYGRMPVSRVRAASRSPAPTASTARHTWAVAETLVVAAARRRLVAVGMLRRSRRHMGGHRRRSIDRGGGDQGVHPHEPDDRGQDHGRVNPPHGSASAPTEPDDTVNGFQRNRRPERPRVRASHGRFRGYADWQQRLTVPRQDPSRGRRRRSAGMRGGLRPRGMRGAPRGGGGVPPESRGVTPAGALRARQVSAPGRIRTCDTRFRKPMLYPLSYEGEGGSDGPSRELRPRSPKPDPGYRRPHSSERAVA